MDKLMINDLSGYINQEVVSYFLVQQKELREGKRDYYVRLKLADKTGTVNANIWNNAKALSDKFKAGDIIKVKSVVILYKEQLQLTVNNVKKAQSFEYDMNDFIKTGSKDINELSQQLFDFIDSIEDEYLSTLMHNIFDDKEFFTKFTKAPAAKGWHHNYMGGLLEHSVCVAMVCNFSATIYPVNRDLLLCGALLHDIGKVEEYSSTGIIDFTTEGRLIGHICLGDSFVVERAKKIDNFPAKTLMKLRHLILSHHGEYEKASARLPQMIEAIVLHFADNIDAQTVGVKQLIEAQHVDSDWSEFDNLNHRYYFTG